MFVMVLIFFAVKWIPNIKKKTIMQMHKFLDIIHKSKKKYQKILSYDSTENYEIIHMRVSW